MLVCWVIVLVTALPTQAYTAEISILSCPTILDALHKDWRATQNLFEQYGSSSELNPIIRAVGPDLYFGTWLLVMAAQCKENRQWQYLSIVFWLAQTWAVNTHHATGTIEGVPLLTIQVNLDAPATVNRETTAAANLPRFPAKQIPAKWRFGEERRGATAPRGSTQERPVVVGTDTDVVP